MSAVISNPFTSLWSDIQTADNFPAHRPLLAHYTSIETLEQILINNEMWFSNPLYMNDIEELRFGLNEGAAAFRQHSGIREACGEPARYSVLLQSFDNHFQQFDQIHAFDTYVLCFSEHHIDDTDGLLSMWRGYGNNGHGVAIVIDTAKIEAVGIPLLIVSKVSYASRDERLQWIKNKLDEFAGLLKQVALSGDALNAAASALLERIKTFAIFTKHRGFREEKEWRFVHVKQYDQGQLLEKMLSYAIGRRGLEPKLKFKLAPIEGITAGDLGIEKLVHQIILGPSISNLLTAKTVGRMLEQLGKGLLIERLRASSTPFRTV
jgi:hypothetical protein